MDEPTPDPYEPTAEFLQDLQVELEAMEATDPELAARRQRVNDAWERLLRAEAESRRRQSP